MTGAARKRPIDPDTRRRIVELRTTERLSYEILGARFQRSSATVREICLDAGLDAGRAGPRRYFHETPGVGSTISTNSLPAFRLRGPE
jgi:hypothetical protein